MPPTSATTVLVADDDDDVRALVAASLRADGYNVLEAKDGLDLLAKVEKGLDDARARPDVVVADVKMPRLSGLGALHAIQRARLNCAVILMTVLGDESVLTVAKKFGARCVLRKPFDVDELRSAVRSACPAPRGQ